MTHQLLIAEDNAATAAVERFALERAGYEVTVARNGEEALDALQAAPGEHAFDLVLADEQMPRMTGRELRQQMRKCSRLSEVPFILLTAKRWEINPEQTLEELGIERLLAKPFSPTELVEMVNQVLQ